MRLSLEKKNNNNNNNKRSRFNRVLCTDNNNKRSRFNRVLCTIGARSLIIIINGADSIGSSAPSVLGP